MRGSDGYPIDGERTSHATKMHAGEAGGERKRTSGLQTDSPKPRQSPGGTLFPIRAEHDGGAPQGCSATDSEAACISRRSAFLLAYRETGSIRAAADVANIAPAQHYHWFKNDSAYRRDFEDVHEVVVGGLQDEIVELAFHGRL